MTLKTNFVGLDEKRREWEVEKLKSDTLLAQDGESSLPAKRQKIENEIAELKGKLDAPNRLYQEYLTALQAWQGRTNR